jgi:ankyrin repeat protein
MNWFRLVVSLASLFVIIAICGCGYNGLTGGDSMGIWEAVEREDLDAIRSYVRNGGDLDVGARRFGKTPLLHALVLQKKESYSTLLEFGADPNTICRGGGEIMLPNSSVVHHAALEEDPFWIRSALESGGDPNQMNGAKLQQNGRPLRFAIMKERIENVRLLCEFGADVDAPVDHFGRTALYQACGSFEIVFYLLSQGADFSEPRPVHELHSFIHVLRHMKPGHPVMTPHNQEWFTAVWDWLIERGKDPEKAKWTGSRWVWED